MVKDRQTVRGAIIKRGKIVMATEKLPGYWVSFVFFVALTIWGLWPAVASADHASFKREILPILEEYCVDCHQVNGNGYEASGLDLSSYEGVMKGTWHGPVVVPGDAFVSNLMVLIEGRADKSLKMPHNDRGEPTKSDRITLRKWITGGARPDVFEAEVQLIFGKYCVECHVSGGEGYIASGLDLSTYEGVIKGTKYGPVVVSGDPFLSNLMVVIEGRAAAYLKMPHSKYKRLSKWEKHLIRAWINRGAKNN